MEFKGGIFIIYVTILLGCMLTSADGQCQSCINYQKKNRLVDITYEESLEHVENPGRGFMMYTISRASDPDPLTVERLDNYRRDDGITVVWRQWVLDSFVESDISQEFIEHIHADFEIIREARFSAIVRFMYTSDQVEDAPYGDATKDWMLRHIEQVRDVLYNNEDVIITVQAGFIGTWGEWYYTTYFGDPNFLDWSDPDNVKGLTPENWQDRHDILNALLANIPPNITVAVRYPVIKYHLLEDDIPTQEEDMKQTNKKYRISSHNDCFVSSPDDVGTYLNFEEEYAYLEQDLLYSNIGGETCRIDTETERHLCSNVLDEMRELRYSYLNQGYNADVLDIWKADGCYENFHREMGYRFALRSASLPDVLQTGNVFCFTIIIENIGYAAPIKNRDLELVFRDTESGTLYSAGIPGVDIRSWSPGETQIIEDGVTVSLVPGTYEVLLALKPDSEFQTSQFSDYNILMANLQVPEYTTGLNSLLHTIQITSKQKSQRCNSLQCPDLVESPPQVDSVYDRRYCGWGECQGVGCSNFPILNPSFEAIGNWESHGDGGFEYTTETASHGVQSVKIINGGARQVFTFDQGTREFTVEADSKNEGVSGEDGSLYSIYCDVKLVDESWMYGETANFEVGNSEWHTKLLQVTADQDIEEGWCYAMFEGYSEGTAYFDHFRVTSC